MKIGDKIVWYHDLSDPTSKAEGTITRMAIQQQTSVCWVDRKHRPEDCLYLSVTWPAAYAEELAAIVQERARLKKAYDDSMILVYQLRNKIARLELREG